MREYIEYLIAQEKAAKNAILILGKIPRHGLPSLNISNTLPQQLANYFGPFYFSLACSALKAAL